MVLDDNEVELMHGPQHVSVEGEQVFDNERDQSESVCANGTGVMQVIHYHRFFCSMKKFCCH